MTIDSDHPVLRECLATFEFLRVLGYTSDDIFFAVDAAPDGTGILVSMVLRYQGHDFIVNIGTVDASATALAAAWRLAVARWNSQEMTNEERMKIFHESFIWINKVSALTALRTKGFPTVKAEVEAGAFHEHGDALPRTEPELLQ